MRIFDDRIVRLLDEAMKAPGEGHRLAASMLVKLLRSGEVAPAALDDVAADLAKRWGPEVRAYFQDLCRKAGLCD